jgi:transposase-like protein
MARGIPVDINLRKEITDRLRAGEDLYDLASEYNMPPPTLYYWKMNDPAPIAQPIPEDIKIEIINKINNGARISHLAKEYNISDFRIRNWGVPRKAKPALAPLVPYGSNIDQQIDIITNDFVKKTKKLLIGQIYMSLQAI